jgi:hypothetical protein
MKTKLFSFILLLLCFIKGFCQQEPYVYFDSIYDCTNNKQSVAYTVHETDYGYISAGGSEVTNEVIFIQKTDKQGKQIEVKIFEQAGRNLWAGYAGSFIKTIDGGFALGGGVTTSLNNKVLLVKFNTSGDTIWTREFGDNISGSFCTGRQCKQTKDKGYIIVGEKEMGTHDEDVLLIKTDSLGNLQWQKNYGDARIAQGWSIAVTPDSGYLIGGVTWVWDVSRSRNALVIKTDSLGNVQWQKEFGGPFDDGSAIVNYAKDGNLFVMLTYAYSQPYASEPSTSKLNIIKLDMAGNIIWDKKLGPLRFAYEMDDIYELSNGNIVTAGFYLPSIGPAIATIFMLSANGDSIWMRDYKRVLYNGLNVLYNIKQTSDNGLITCGLVFGISEPPYGTNMWLLKLDSVGCLEPNCDGTIIIEPKNKNNDNILKVFPNPAQNYFTVEYKIVEPAGSAVIEMLDITGKILKQFTLYDKQNQIVIETIDLQTGIYYIRLLVDGGTSKIQKISVIK